MLSKTQVITLLTVDLSQTSQWKSRVAKLQWLKVILSNTVVGLSVSSSPTVTWNFYMLLLNQICLPQSRTTG